MKSLGEEEEFEVSNSMLFLTGEGDKPEENELNWEFLVLIPNSGGVLGDSTGENNTGGCCRDNGIWIDPKL